MSDVHPRELIRHVNGFRVICIDLMSDDEDIGPLPVDQQHLPYLARRRMNFRILFAFVDLSHSRIDPDDLWCTEYWLLQRNPGANRIDNGYFHYR